MLSYKIKLSYKGLKMSKLDLTVQEKTLLKVNEMQKNLINSNKESLSQEGIDGSNKMDIDLKDWIEVFEEDQVKLQGCR